MTIEDTNSFAKLVTIWPQFLKKDIFHWEQAIFSSLELKNSPKFSQKKLILYAESSRDEQALFEWLVFFTNNGLYVISCNCQRVTTCVIGSNYLADLKSLTRYYKVTGHINLFHYSFYSNVMCNEKLICKYV